MEKEPYKPMSDENEYRLKLDIFGTPVMDVGRYASLLWGISQVVGDDPSIDSIIAAGILYGAFSVLHNLFSKGHFRYHTKGLERRLISNLEKLVKDDKKE